MKPWQQTFIQQHRVARLATVDEEGQPHAVPIVYAFDGQRLYTPIDEKPKSVEPYRLRRARNIQANGRATVIVDHYEEDWRQLAWVQIRGTAQIVESGPDHEQGRALLEAKYPQYETMPLGGRPIIIITPHHVTGWRASSEKNQV